MKRAPHWSETKEALRQSAGRPVTWCKDCSKYYRSDRFEGHKCQ